MKAEIKETIIAVILAILGLAYVTAFIGWVFSLEPQIRPIPVYVKDK